MERRIFVRIVAYIAFLAALLWSQAPFAQERMVLVAAQQSPIEALTLLEVRKIYLGVNVTRDGRRVVGIRNLSSPRLNEIFLQNVVGLTESRYETRLISNLVRFGSARPREVRRIPDLREMLRLNPMAVSYLLVDDDASLTGLKILRVLWEGS